MSIDLSQFQQTFIDESLEGLDVMESSLLKLELGSVDNELINTIFRAAHSIKGGSATFGFEHVAGFTHVMETLLDEIRDGVRNVTEEIVTLLLDSVDVLRDMIKTLNGDGAYDEARMTSLKQRLETILNEGDTSTDAAKSENPVTASVKSSAWKIFFIPHSDMMQTGNDPLRIIRELGELGQLTLKANESRIPGFSDMVPEDCYLSWEMTLEGDVSKEAINEIFAWVEDECDLTIEPIESTVIEEPSSISETTPSPLPEKLETKSAQSGAENKTASAVSGKQKTATTATEAASIRVGIDKVDALINMVGELVITQSMLHQLGEYEEFSVAEIERLKEGLAQLERNTRELQESVMSIRMLPISFVFSRFPRMIHDLSKKLGKKVDLVMSGEHTELDKTVMEKIGDPLVHLVRNAVDHGIESEEKRLQAGKPATGKVNLNAYHQGGNIVIEIHDDGAGLDKQKLLIKAREKGLIKEDESLSDDQIYDIIFMPGFSTAASVSDVSGRGVGMDVVRRNIISLGGSIEIESELGKGAVFRVRLPLTLAILDGQTIRVGGELYIIPLVSIMESIQIKQDRVRLVGGDMELFKLREDYLPIIRLHEVFEIENAVQRVDEGLLVVVEGGGKRVGLLVDELLGQQQVVIKSLETNFKKVDGVSGATILGDGSVALIADIPGLIRKASDIKQAMPNKEIA